MAHQDPSRWEITPADRARYDTAFKNAGGDTHKHITGPQMSYISGLPLADTGHIFRVSDIDKDVKLNKNEFAIAMFLVERRKEGCTIPHAVPPSLISSSSLVQAAELPPPFNPAVFSYSHASPQASPLPSPLPSPQPSPQASPLSTPNHHINQIVAEKEHVISNLQNQLRDTQHMLLQQQERAHKLSVDLSQAQEAVQRSEMQLVQARNQAAMQRHSSSPSRNDLQQLNANGGASASSMLESLDLERITSLDEAEALCVQLKAKLTQAKARRTTLQQINQQRKIEELESTLMCPICMDQKKNVSCVPCGHALCKACADAMFSRGGKKCPMCRIVVRETNPIFL